MQELHYICVKCNIIEGIQKLNAEVMETQNDLNSVKLLISYNLKNIKSKMTTITTSCGSSAR